MFTNLTVSGHNLILSILCPHNTLHCDLVKELMDEGRLQYCVFQHKHQYHGKSVRIMVANRIVLEVTKTDHL